MEADSLFAQTLRELDTIFYATFPAASQSKFQEEAAHEQLHLHHYYGDEAPPLECARPSTRSTYDRPSHALQPAHPYQHFSKHYRRVSPNLPLQRPPPPAQGHLHALPAKLVIPKPPSEKNDHQPLENKPLLACFFCRGRKLSCGRPLSGRPDKICGQCHRRSLRCEYPSESRRGRRPKKSVNVSEADTPPTEAPAPDPASSA